MNSRFNAKFLAIGACAIALAFAAGCHSSASGSIGAECLTNVKLVDSAGAPFELSSLKGKPAVVDFIYTQCHGPCLMETAKMANVALRLGSDLGPKASIVTITVDPEHDHPKQLRNYAKAQGADDQGWYFLTGSPSDIDAALAGFHLTRQREPDGSVAHLVDMVLVGPSGREVKEYNGEAVNPETIAKDVKGILSKAQAS
ncbi:MAG: SCO family protein [Candidatus Binataceae bacterium]